RLSSGHGWRQPTFREGYHDVPRERRPQSRPSGGCHPGCRGRRGPLLRAEGDPPALRRVLPCSAQRLPVLHLLRLLPPPRRLTPLASATAPPLTPPAMATARLLTPPATATARLLTPPAMATARLLTPPATATAPSGAPAPPVPPDPAGRLRSRPREVRLNP